MTSAPNDHAGHGEHHEEHHGGVGLYLGVFLALCVLTGASFFTCSSYWPFKDTESIGWAFMMAVSCTKAMLVILFFMHLKWEANWKYILTIPALFMSIFMVCMLVPDVGLRTRHFSEEREVFAAEYVEHDDEHAAAGHGESGHGESGHTAEDHSVDGHGESSGSHESGH